MKTQTLNKLDLKKRSLVELNDSELNDVNGGHPTLIIFSFYAGVSVGVIISAITRDNGGD